MEKQKPKIHYLAALAPFLKGVIEGEKAPEELKKKAREELDKIGQQINKGKPEDFDLSKPAYNSEKQDELKNKLNEGTKRIQEATGKTLNEFKEKINNLMK